MKQSSKHWVELHAQALEHFGAGLSVYPWLLKHGIEFSNPIKRPKEIPKGAMRYCFKNCGDIVLDAFLTGGVQRYWYCEGYAIPEGLFPMEHAWLVDDAGNTIDPTWTKGSTSYFGVAFETDYVVKHATETEYYGVLFPQMSSKLNLSLWTDHREILHPVTPRINQG